MPRRSAAVAVLVAVASLTLTACSTPTPNPPAPARADLGLQHVHGLDVDPADGTLYAATHSGLFRLPEVGEAKRVADRYQDTMGFTVAGPGTFLGSGHPDSTMDPEMPTRLGLIRSADGGESWEVVSLGGQADLHVLRVEHGSLYAWDAATGQVMISADQGRTWEARSTLDLRDFVVDPADPAVLLAATEQGLLRSADGGRSWVAVSGAPAVAVLAWAAGTSLYAITAAGVVHQSTDGGTTWTVRGTINGQAEALAVNLRDGVESIYVAASPGTILVSRDSGASFSVRYAD